MEILGYMIISASPLSLHLPTLLHIGLLEGWGAEGPLELDLSLGLGATS